MNNPIPRCKHCNCRMRDAHPNKKFCSNKGRNNCKDAHHNAIKDAHNSINNPDALWDEYVDGINPFSSEGLGQW